MGTGTTYELTAYNTATASTNKIHDDTVARRYGFGGGLVPGVDVYAYMTHLPAAGLGLDWLGRGAMRARFVAPVYDGEEVRVVGDGASLEVRNGGGSLCATGSAGIPDEPPPQPRADRWADVAPATSPPPASPEALQPGTALALAPHRFHADLAGEYLADVREDLALYRDEGVAHPGWLLRDANYVLSANVVLGPWIHVESVVQHFGVVRDGDEVRALATVSRQWEHKGHQFVELDVGILAADAVVVHVAHTAIFQPREPE
jgi:hypothetical protein